MSDHPRAPRNTWDIEPAQHVFGALAQGRSEYITGMEAQGQREVVDSDTLPTECDEAALTALGVQLGEPVPGDPLFRYVTLPDGWTRQGSDHDMWSYVLDEHGRRRIAVFYKAAFYDRRADCHVERFPPPQAAAR